MDPITFLSGTALGGVLGYLVRTLIEHRLSKDRASYDRQSIAAREFRNKVNEALTQFQRREEKWTLNNRNLRAAADFVHIIDLSVKDFAAFLSGERKNRFINKWQETKDYCSTTLPKSWTRGESIDSNESKLIFFQHVDDLLKFAEQK